MKFGHLFLFLAVPAVLFTGGCERRSVATAEAAERSDSLFKKASDAETIADYDTAIHLYQELVNDKPRMASAQLQLAILLHDRKQDYMGAVYHYNRYLALQPDSEKQRMVQDRIQKAEQSLTSHLFKRVGTTMQGFTEAELLKSKETLEKELTRAQAETIRAAEKNQELEKRNTDLENQVVQLRKLLESLRAQPAASSGGGTSAGDIAEARRLAGGNAPKGNDPSIASVRADASRMLAPLDNASKKPREYTVKEGENLYRIAERFYGDANKRNLIQDANRTRIGPKGELRAGQTILLP